MVPPMVVVPKKSSAEPRMNHSGSHRPKQICEATCLYPTRVTSEIVASIPPGMWYFTTLDSRHGYWQVLLDHESSKLTTFISPWGAYRFRRNVMGLISAVNEHNRRGDEVLAGFDNVQKVVEDFLFNNADQATHVQRVRNALHPGKFLPGAPTVSYCGFGLSSSGYTVDNHLAKALIPISLPPFLSSFFLFLFLSFPLPYPSTFRMP